MMGYESTKGLCLDGIEDNMIYLVCLSIVDCGYYET